MLLLIGADPVTAGFARHGQKRAGLVVDEFIRRRLAVAQRPADQPKHPETRLVVIGDSDFAANDSIAFEGNSNLFVNTLNWLSEQENLIAIRPKAPDDRRVTMTEDQMRLVGWLSLIFVPGAVFAIGVYTWWRRRG